MERVRKTAVVPYSAEQMYALVNDIERYPEFLPWCSGTSVSHRTDTSLRATVSLAVGRIRQSFTTENIMRPGRLIEVHLVSGPFRRLHGYWAFEPVDDDSCRVELEMDFEFKNRLLKAALSKVFTAITNSLVDAFVARAGKTIGRRQP